VFGISILTSAQSRVNSVPFSTFSAQNEANLKINTVTAVVALVLAVTAVVALVLAVTAVVALVLAVTAVVALVLAVTAVVALVLAVTAVVAIVLAVTAEVALVLAVTAVVALVLAVTAVVALVPAVTAEVALVLAVTAVFQQDRKCGYNVTTRSVGETTVAVAKQYYVLRPRVSAALPRQHATLLHRLRPTPSSAACPVLPCFFRIIS